MNRVLANTAIKAKWRDAESFEYHVEPSGEALQIAAESGSPDKRKQSGGLSNPLKIVGRNLRHLLAQISRLGQASPKH
jgi:hypothetical protein